MTDDPPDNGKPYDSAREQLRVAETTRELTGGITEVPRWWRVEVARFMADEPTPAPGTPPLWLM